jgi:hypothetical protein
MKNQALIELADEIKAIRATGSRLRVKRITKTKRPACLVCGQPITARNCKPFYRPFVADLRQEAPAADLK